MYKINLIANELDDRKICRITTRKSFDGYNKEEWPETVFCLVDHIKRMDFAMRPWVVEIGMKLKSFEPTSSLRDVNRTDYGVEK